MTVANLVAKYIELFGALSRTHNKAFLVRRIAYHLQKLAEGDLSPPARAKIEELATLTPLPLQTTPPSSNSSHLIPLPLPSPNRDPRLPVPGSELVRIYQGVEHRVVVLEEGFEFQGKRYRSLSHIARIISKTPWNGFLFFHLQRRVRPEKAEEALG